MLKCKLVGIFLFLLLCSCEKEEFTIERLANAVWSSDDSRIFKVYSLYDTTDPDEIYYYAPSGKNWRYRFEVADSALTSSVEVGSCADIQQGGTLESVFIYWLSSLNVIATINPSAQAVLKDYNGHETILAPPDEFIKKVFVYTNGSYSAMGIAPSPNEGVIAVYLQGAYFVNSATFELNFHQCISFFDSKTGSHLFSQEIPQRVIYFAIEDKWQINNRSRGYFIWAKDGSGVYLVARQVSYFISYTEGIKEVDSVPDRMIITNSGNISNSGRKLQVVVDRNSSSLEIIQIPDWVPFDQVGLVPKEDNDYSFW